MPVASYRYAVIQVTSVLEFSLSKWPVGDLRSAALVLEKG